MSAITKILTYMALGLIPSFSIGQTIEFYDFSVSTVYLPSCGSQGERYLKVDNKAHRVSSIIDWRYCERIKSKNLPKDKNIENAINHLDSLTKLEEFTFRISPSLIDTLKTRHFWKMTYQITDQDIDSFFKNHDTVTLKLKDIEPENFEGHVIDGVPYWINLKLKRQGQDTLNYSFAGNFDDGVKTSNIGNWLPMYLTIREFHFFTSVKLVREYFNDKELEGILFRFIAWTKNE